MSAKRLSSWGKWQQTRNTLSTSLALNVAARNGSAPGSAEEGQLNRNINKTLEDMQEHALNGLRMVDLAITDQNLVSTIKIASEAAKREADRLKNATASVNKLTGFVTQLTQLVGLFTRL
ncbi:hypothetical protein N9M66_04230 [Litoreibacter sp.]|nr:hypothetical protein [Litoreibacter sp.]